MNGTITIIPARGDSKRLPNKNSMHLNGKPLIAYSIEYAKQNIEIVGEIYVTTDNKEIKDIALQFGAKVIDRPKELADEYSSTVSALKHVLENVEGSFDDVILLQPTNPLRPKNLLKEAYKTYLEKKYDSLMTVSRNQDKLGKVVNEEFIPFNYKFGQRSQDLEPLYYENGLLYITKSSLILNNSIIAKNCYPYIVDHPYAKIDIDTITDFNYAEFLISCNK
jgi:CMP-N-acetylneuraminic acid synthetase